jgi:toxin ParE1/3/4
MKVVWSESAIADLAAIQAFVARDSVHYANVLVGDILAAVEQLEHFPRSGRVVPERGDEAIRELVVGNLRVIHLVGESDICVLAVIHGARDMNYFRN